MFSYLGYFLSNTLFSGAWLIRRQFPCPSSLGYLCPVAYAQLVGDPKCLGSPQTWVNLTLVKPPLQALLTGASNLLYNTEKISSLSLSEGWA
jgi:hypothetical protein